MDTDPERDARAAERAAKIAAAVGLVEEGPHGDERALGILRLGQLQARHDLVRSACWSKSVKVCAAGAEAIGCFADENDRERLEELTAAADHRVRVGACRGLGIAGFLDSIELLGDIAHDDSESADVRRAAVIALSRCAAGASEEVQIEVIDQVAALHASGAFDLRCVAQAYGTIGHAAARDLLSEEIRRAIAHGCDEPTARALLKGLARHELDEPQVLLCVQALDALPGGRTVAASILADHPTELARPALERQLADPSSALAAACVGALCELGLSASLDKVEAIFTVDSPAAVAALGKLQGDAGAALAERIAVGGHVGLRPAALRSLSRIDEQQGVILSERLVGDPNANVRLVAFEVLCAAPDRASRWRPVWAADPVPWVSARSVPVPVDG